MKTTIRALALVLLVCGGGAPTADVRAGPDAGRARARRPARPLGPPHTVAASTIRVHDGDTYYTGVETIRLRGIDTPEPGRPPARPAAAVRPAAVRAAPLPLAARRGAGPAAAPPAAAARRRAARRRAPRPGPPRPAAAPTTRAQDGGNDYTAGVSIPRRRI